MMFASYQNVRKGLRCSRKQKRSRRTLISVINQETPNQWRSWRISDVWEVTAEKNQRPLWRISDVCEESIPCLLWAVTTVKNSDVCEEQWRLWRLQQLLILHKHSNSFQWSLLFPKTFDLSQMLLFFSKVTVLHYRHCSSQTSRFFSNVTDSPQTF